MWKRGLYTLKSDCVFVIKALKDTCIYYRNNCSGNVLLSKQRLFIFLQKNLADSLSCPVQLQKFSKFVVKFVQFFHFSTAADVAVCMTVSLTEDSILYGRGCTSVACGCTCGSQQLSLYPSHVNKPVNWDESHSNRNRLDRLKWHSAALWVADSVCIIWEYGFSWVQGW